MLSSPVTVFFIACISSSDNGCPFTCLTIACITETLPLSLTGAGTGVGSGSLPKSIPFNSSSILNSFSNSFIESNTFVFSSVDLAPLNSSILFLISFLNSSTLVIN